MTGVSRYNISDNSPFAIKFIDSAAPFRSGEPIEDNNPLPVSDITAAAGNWVAGEAVNQDNPLPVKVVTTDKPFISGESITEENPLPVILR